jgi:hypothetical protein
VNAYKWQLMEWHNARNRLKCPTPGKVIGCLTSKKLDDNVRAREREREKRVMEHDGDGGAERKV